MRAQNGQTCRGSGPCLPGIPSVNLRPCLNVLHNQVLASSPHSVEALVARAKAHRAAEQLPEALQDLALAHDLNPTNRFLNLQFDKELTLARHDNRPALSSQMHIGHFEENEG